MSVNTECYICFEGNDQPQLGQIVPVCTSGYNHLAHPVCLAKWIFQTEVDGERQWATCNHCNEWIRPEALDEITQMEPVTLRFANSLHVSERDQDKYANLLCNLGSGCCTMGAGAGALGTFFKSATCGNLALNYCSLGCLTMTSAYPAAYCCLPAACCTLYSTAHGVHKLSQCLRGQPDYQMPRQQALRAQNILLDQYEEFLDSLSDSHEHTD